MEKQSTKELYLITALRLFAEKGFDTVSVSQIASAVGLSAPALYRHFESKQVLFDAIIDMSNHSFSSRMGKLASVLTAIPMNRLLFSCCQRKNRFG